MNQTVKTLAAAILIAAVPSAAAGAGTPSSTAFQPIQTVDDSSHFEAKRHCFNECPKPKLSGSGAFVVR
ncbi:MAG: hypothetical protein ACFCU2_05195 [Acidimicrobiia bacterium]